MGSVPLDKKREIEDRIIEGLQRWYDPKTGQRVIKRVYRATEIYHGDYVAKAPDLVLGFNEGYRSSWQTALGASPEPLIEDNLKKWSGDHCLDPSIVPASLFSNKKIIKKDPSLVDIGPTVISELGFHIPEYMEGKSIFRS